MYQMGLIVSKCANHLINCAGKTKQKADGRYRITPDKNKNQRKPGKLNLFWLPENVSYLCLFFTEFLGLELLQKVHKIQTKLPCDKTG